MQPKTEQKIRWFLIAVIGISVSWLTRYSYTTGVYVGDSRVRTEAAMVGAGHYDIFGPLGPDGQVQWIWTPDPVMAEYMRQHPEAAREFSRHP